MTFITDSKHLASRIQDGLVALLALQDAWLDEDARACAPRSGSGTAVSGGPRSDPTHRVATSDADRYADRDRLGAAIHRAVSTLERLVDEREPREVVRKCVCCEVHDATHGRDGTCEEKGCATCEGRGCPTDCWACWRYLRRSGVRCDGKVHEGRPEPARFCECPPSCCDAGSCPDRAADGRTVSERCKKRMQRGRVA